MDDEAIRNILSQFKQMLAFDWADDCSPGISPQLKRKLLHLVGWIDDGRGDLPRLVWRISSVLHRILLELVQAHSNTTERERKFVKLVSDKGCSIKEPELTDFVIERLTKLYKAAGACADTSFERRALMKFLLQEIGGTELEGKYKEQEVRKVVQTLYKCSCFEVTNVVGAPSRLKLKDHLCDPAELRQMHDVELIKMAQSGHIRLPPESWLQILYKRSFAGDLSYLQSLIDKHQTPVTVTELEDSIEVEDRYKLRQSLADLKFIEDTSNYIMDQPKETTISPDIVRALLTKLSDLRHTFTIRQSR